MEFRVKSPNSIINRSKSLYEDTRNSFRFSSIRSKLRSVSSSLSKTRVFPHADANGAEKNCSEVGQLPKAVSLRTSEKKLNKTSASKSESLPDRTKATRVKTSSTTEDGRHKKHRRTRKRESEGKVKIVADKSTINYEVKQGDTLTSVAARFQSTPSELCQLNKLFCRNLFFGQLIKVPKPTEDDAPDDTSEQAHSKEEIKSDENQSMVDDLSDRKRKCVSFHDGLRRVSLSDSNLSSSDYTVSSSDVPSTSSNEASEVVEDYRDEENDPSAALYLKMQSDYVIDFHRTISGVLLFTTTSLVFTPVLHDQIETELYQLMLPLNKLRSVAVYEDDSVMYFTKRDLYLAAPEAEEPVIQLDTPTPSIERTCSLEFPKIHGEPLRRIRSDSAASLEKSNVNADISEREIGHTRELSDFNEVILENPVTATTSSRCLCVLASKDDQATNRHPHWFTVQSEEYWFRIPEDKATPLFEFLKTCKFPRFRHSRKTFDSIPSTEVDLLATPEDNMDHCGFVVVPKSFIWILPRIGTFDEVASAMIRHKRPRGSNRPSRRRHRSVHLPMSGNSDSMNEPRSGRDIAQAKSLVEFPAFEEERTVLQMLKHESVRWELVHSHELELLEENEQKHKFIRENLLLSSPEKLPIPASTSSSRILDPNKVRQILINLPPEAEGLDWLLVYSTAKHGFSLKTLYHRCKLTTSEIREDRSDYKTLNATQTTVNKTQLFSSIRPCILLILTASREIFGAMLSTPPQVSGGRFYGNGSCYVFRWEQSDTAGTDKRAELGEEIVDQDRPDSNTEPQTPKSESSCSTESGVEVSQELVDYLQLGDLGVTVRSTVKDSQPKFEKFTWTGKNSFFINGENDSLSIGCSHGHCALFLDDLLLRGRTEACDTFDNPPLCRDRDFIVNDLEIWSFC